MAASLSFSFPGQLSYIDDSSLTHIPSYDQLPHSRTFYLICVYLFGVFASSLPGKAAGSGLQHGDVLPEKAEMLLTSRCQASRSSSRAVLQKELRGAEGQGLSHAELPHESGLFAARQAQPRPTLRCGQGAGGPHRDAGLVPRAEKKPPQSAGGRAAAPRATTRCWERAVPGCLRGPSALCKRAGELQRGGADSQPLGESRAS